MIVVRVLMGITVVVLFMIAVYFLVLSNEPTADYRYWYFAIACVFSAVAGGMAHKVVHWEFPRKKDRR